MVLQKKNTKENLFLLHHAGDLVLEFALHILDHIKVLGRIPPMKKYSNRSIFESVLSALWSILALV